MVSVVGAMIVFLVRGVALRAFFFFLKDPPPTKIYPLPLPDALPISTLKLDGSETFDLLDIAEPEPRQNARLLVRRKSGKTDEVPVIVRIDTPIEVEYYRHGGILRSEEHTAELQSRLHLVCRLLLDKK